MQKRSEVVYIMADRKPKFTFHLAEGKRFLSLEDKDNQDLLLKWSMKDTLIGQMFTFDQTFQAYQKDDFVLDFMTDPLVLSNLKMASSGSGTSVVGQPADKVQVETVPCTVLSLSFFDRLYENFVRESGHIHKCFDEFCGDFTISDELRKMLLLEESDHYELFSEIEREEFLFRLFRHICLGGQVCQYEDNVNPYLNVTKLVYKDLISVQKNPETKELSIISSVFKISALDKDGEVYYPACTQHDQNFSYLIVDPLKRHVSVLYNKFGGGLFA